MSRVLATNTPQAVLVPQLQRDGCLYTSCYCEENIYKLVERLHQYGVPLENLDVVFLSNVAKKVPLWCQRGSADGPGGDGLVVWDYHVILVQHLQPQQPGAPGSPTGAIVTGLLPLACISCPPCSEEEVGSGAEGGGAAADEEGGSESVGPSHHQVRGASGSGASTSTNSASSKGSGSALSPCWVSSSSASGAHVSVGAPVAAVVWDLDSVLSFPCSGQEYASRALRCGQTRHLARQFWRKYRVVPAAAYLQCFASDRSHMRHPKAPHHPDPHHAHNTHSSLPFAPHGPVSSPPPSTSAVSNGSLHGSWDDVYEWLAPQPLWPPIVSRDGSGTTMNLHRYWDMDTSDHEHESTRVTPPAATAAATVSRAARSIVASAMDGLSTAPGDGPSAAAGAAPVTVQRAGRFGVVHREESFVSQVLGVAAEGLVGLHGWAISDSDEPCRWST